MPWTLPTTSCEYDIELFVHLCLESSNYMDFLILHGSYVGLGNPK